MKYIFLVYTIFMIGVISAVVVTHQKPSLSVGAVSENKRHVMEFCGSYNKSIRAVALRSDPTICTRADIEKALTELGVNLKNDRDLNRLSCWTADTVLLQNERCLEQIMTLIR